jgi:hypothetical protein
MKLNEAQTYAVTKNSAGDAALKLKKVTPLDQVAKNTYRIFTKGSGQAIVIKVLGFEDSTMGARM